MIDLVWVCIDDCVISIFSRFYVRDLVFVFSISACSGTGDHFSSSPVYDLPLKCVDISRDQSDHVHLVHDACICIGYVVCGNRSIGNDRDGNGLVFVSQILFGCPLNIVLIDRRIRIGEIDLYIGSQFLSCILFHDIC